MDDRRFLIDVTGPDAATFLQGLVTNDISRAKAGLVYAAMLTPQGKYLADFFIVAQGDGFIIDAPAEQGPGLLQRLSMYRLRAAVTLTPSTLGVARGTGAEPAGALPDPRHPAMGWRLYGAPDNLPGADSTDWDALRVAHLIPQAGIELIANDSYILETGFERLHGVDFRKGCYVGQEVTARMKHKTELKKRLIAVRVTGDAQPGTPITLPDGREAGKLFTRAGDRAIAYLRFDRLGPGLTAGTATITVEP